MQTTSNTGWASVIVGRHQSSRRRLNTRFRVERNLIYNKKYKKQQQQQQKAVGSNYNEFTSSFMQSAAVRKVN